MNSSRAMAMRRNRRLQKGVISIEMVGVLVVLGLLAFVLFQKSEYLYDTARIWIFKYQVGEVSSAVVEVSQGNTTAGIDMDKIKFSTPSWIGDGTDAVIFGGNFTVAGGSEPYSYVVSADQMPTRVGHRIAAGWDQATYDESSKVMNISYGL
ncbi:TPA: hypothetical protein JG825_003426 [Vibrio parahaemolyticus]|uniref:hypothetical protein n=1 Tax=Vibrio harveyi group TaxID=717610 RepID=UPI0018F21538|nr:MULTISPECIES: hypothetical protein [Vibrio harveyi group]MCR9909631.1 hypothetical protein [Vibrio campbellii]UPR19012.1 hypothetical protein H9J99_26050 [Vibrio parahaemolyticus]HAV1520107.1 hypothetical protein [Vibrio parahaemolyticus]HAV1539074.1 hypothetical protein [Vibrio parahaemolyticus]